MSHPPKWIWIRGLARCATHWGPFENEFRQTFPEAEIEMLDLRGNGGLVHSPSYWTILENVRDLRSRSRFIQDGHPVFIMSISLGSMVAVEWAHRFPEEVAGLVAVNTSDRGSSSFHQRLRPQNYLKIRDLLSSRQLAQEIEKRILLTTTNQMQDVDFWAGEFAKTPLPAVSNFLRQLAAAGTYLFPQQKPKTEILLLSSKMDQLVNPACSEGIAEMWTLKPHMHPTAGHDIPLEDPEWVCREIQSWLRTGAAH